MGSGHLSQVGGREEVKTAGFNLASPSSWGSIYTNSKDSLLLPGALPPPRPPTSGPLLSL